MLVAVFMISAVMGGNHVKLAGNTNARTYKVGIKNQVGSGNAWGTILNPGSKPSQIDTSSSTYGDRTIMSLDHEAIYKAYAGTVVSIDSALGSLGAFDKDGKSVTLTKLK